MLRIFHEKPPLEPKPDFVSSNGPEDSSWDAAMRRNSARRSLESGPYRIIANAKQEDNINMNIFCSNFITRQLCNREESPSTKSSQIIITLRD